MAKRLLGTTNIVKNSDEAKSAYSDFRIASNGKGSWSFDNKSARNVIFGIVNNASSHTDNQKND